MSSGIYNALSGATAQLSALDVAANNVANAGTPGYRAERVKFEEVLSRAGARDIAMVKTSCSASDSRPGHIVSTGGKLDVAIDGDGWFVVTTPKGDRYTRAGNFRIDATRTLVTADGLALRGRNGLPIRVPPDAGDIQLRPDGAVLVGEKAVGLLTLARVPPTTLQREGETLFSAAVPPPPQKGPPPALVVGALEQANFDIVHGVVDLIKISRTYEALHRMIESYKQIEDRAARALGGMG